MLNLMLNPGSAFSPLVSRAGPPFSPRLGIASGHRDARDFRQN